MGESMDRGHVLVNFHLDRRGCDLWWCLSESLTIFSSLFFLTKITDPKVMSMWDDHDAHMLWLDRYLWEWHILFLSYYVRVTFLATQRLSDWRWPKHPRSEQRILSKVNNQPGFSSSFGLSFGFIADHVWIVFRDSGVPSDMEANFPSASIKFANIRIGEIGSTFPGGMWGL